MQATPGGEDGLARGRLKLGRGERILAQYKGSPFFSFSDFNPNFKLGFKFQVSN